MKRIIYFLLAATIVFASCNKKDSMPAAKERHLVKTTMDFGDNTDFTYDGNGRVIRTVAGDHEITYTYTGNTIVEKQKIVSMGVVIADITWTLNSKGQAVTGSGIYTLPGQQSMNVTVTSSFDDAGFITRTDVALGNNTTFNEYIYSNGDMVEIKRFTNNSFSGKTKFYYPGQVVNKVKIGTGEYQFIPGLVAFGKAGAHLPEKEEAISSSGTVISTRNYEYTLDVDGYPVQNKITGSASNILFYHYN
jgi:YD repeat-containing protein